MEECKKRAKMAPAGQTQYDDICLVYYQNIGIKKLGDFIWLPKAVNLRMFQLLLQRDIEHYCAVYSCLEKLSVER